MERKNNRKLIAPKENGVNDFVKPWKNEISLMREMAYPLIFHWSGVDNHQVRALNKKQALPNIKMVIFSLDPKLEFADSMPIAVMYNLLKLERKMDSEEINEDIVTNIVTEGNNKRAYSGISRFSYLKLLPLFSVPTEDT